MQHFLQRVVSGASDAKNGAKRSNFLNRWQDLSNHLLPTDNQFITVSSPGETKQDYIANSQPLVSLELLASAIMAILCNRSTRWVDFEPSYSKDSLNVDPQNIIIKEWIQTNRKILLQNLRDSNYYTNFFTSVKDDLVYGNSCLYSDYNMEKDQLFFKSVFLGEISIDLNEYGEVDTIYRHYKVTRRQLIQKFGYNNVSFSVQEMGDEKNGEEIEVLHAVFPSEDDYYWNAKKDSKGQHYFKFVSLYIEAETIHLLKEGGYHSMPYTFSRDHVSPGEEYGRGLGERALPEIKKLYALSDNEADIIGKTATPPLSVPANMVQGKLNMSNKAINIVREGSRNKIEPTYLPPPNSIPAVMQSVQNQELKISKIFMIELIQLIREKQMTATEVITRDDYSMRLLSSFLEMFETSKLNPIVNRTMELLREHGKLTELPPEIEDYGIDIKYVSILAKGQRLSEITAYEKLIVLAQPYLELDPESAQKLQVTNIIENIADILNLPVDSLKSKAEMKRIEEQRNAEKQEMMEQQRSQIEVEQQKIQSETDLNEAKAQEGEPK